MDRFTTIERRYDLSQPFNIRVPWRISNFAISEFTGDATLTRVRFDASPSAPEKLHPIRLRWGMSGLVGDDGSPGREMWVINDVPQHGRILAIIFSDAPVSLQTGVDLPPAGQATEATLNDLRLRINNLTTVTDGDHSFSPLAANGVYIGPQRRAQGWGRIVGTCFASHDGILRIEQAPAAPIQLAYKWDAVTEFLYRAGDTMGFSSEVVADLWRAVFINGATAQTIFRLSVRTRRI